MNMTTITRIHEKAVLPVLTLVASATAGEISTSPDPMVSQRDYITHQSGYVDVDLSSAGVEVEPEQTRTYKPELKEWTKTLEKRFHELARKEALDQIGSDEATELTRLERSRRALKNPRPADEVLWDINQRQVTEQLVNALTKYVQFHRRPC